MFSDIIDEKKASKQKEKFNTVLAHQIFILSNRIKYFKNFKYFAKD